VAVIRSFSEWIKHSWDVDQLPQVLAHLPRGVAASKEGLKMSKKECMMVLRHALGGERVCFMSFIDL
jgi:hypothetical protein